MTRHRLTTLHRDEAGTAITEAALVMVTMVFFLLLPPAILKIWLNEQRARTEAHRDMFDKTVTMLLLPEAGDTTSSHFGDISVRQRRHAYPTFPPMIDVIDAPDPTDATVGPQVVEIFPDGFPNQYVEGWKYVGEGKIGAYEKYEYAGGWFFGEMDHMRYGAVIRSPWTWMGWPFVATQDAWWEPQAVQGWYDDAGIEAVWVLPFFSLKDSLKLID